MMRFFAWLTEKLDRLFLVTGGLLALLIAGVVVRGDRTFPEVQAFSLGSQTINPEVLTPISAQKAQFRLTFNREMNHESVQAAFRLNPPVEGQFSWIGRKMAFTPKQALPYEQILRLELSGAEDTTGKKQIKAFRAEFQTPARRFAYLGSTREEMLRLVLFEPQTRQKTLLTPPNLLVIEFKPHPDGKRLLFSATDQADLNPKINWAYLQKLFEVDLLTHQIRLLADNQGFINYRFEIAPNGILALGRIELDSERTMVSDGIWLKFPEAADWQRFWYGEMRGVPFFFTPDSNALIGQGPAGFVIVGVTQENLRPQFLGKFMNAYGPTPDGQHLLFSEGNTQDQINENFQIRNQLVVIDQTGKRLQPLEESGLLAYVRPSPDSRFLYYLMAQPHEDIELSPPFHLYRYNWQSQKTEAITQTPDWSEEAFDLSPDGQQAIFERYPALEGDNYGPEFRTVVESVNENLLSADLWIYDQTSQQLTSLDLKGRKPRWIP